MTTSPLGGGSRRLPLRPRQPALRRLLPRDSGDGPASACGSATSSSTSRASARTPGGAAPSLNDFMAAGPDQWAAARAWIAEALRDDVHEARTAPHLHPLDAVDLHLPIEVGDYVDFYASEQHASNVGRMFRPDQEPLLPNWKHLPGRLPRPRRHGRGERHRHHPPVRPAQGTRPRRPPPSARRRRLDIEAELGFVVGVGSALGERVATAHFADHTFGVVGPQRLVGARHPGLGVRPPRARSSASPSPPRSATGSPRSPRSTRPGPTCPDRTRSPLDYLAVDARVGPRHRGGGAAQRHRRLASAVRLDVLVARADARPHHRQRRERAHRRPVGIGHHLRRRARPARARSSSSRGAARSPSPSTASSGPSSRTATR